MGDPAFPNPRAKKYKSKKNNVVVHADMLTEDNVGLLANWTQAQIVEERDSISNEIYSGLNVKTPTGKKRASRGMYIIHHGDSFYVASQGLFESLYSEIQ